MITYFTGVSSKAFSTVTPVLIDKVNTASSIYTRVTDTLINLCKIVKLYLCETVFEKKDHPLPIDGIQYLKLVTNLFHRRSLHIPDYKHIQTSLFGCHTLH